MAAARDAVRETTGGDADRRPGRRVRGVHPGRPARGARQLRGDPQRDAPRDHPADRRGAAGRAERRGDGRRAAAGDRGELRRGRYAGRGDHALGVPGRRRGGRGAARRRRRPSGPATSSPPRPRPPARRWPARRTSCRRCATPASSTPAAAASCVILDAAETALTGRRPPQVEAAPPDPAADPDRRAGRRPGGRRAGVRGDVPARRRGRRDPDAAQPRSAGLGDSLVVVGGEGLWNVHVHVDDVGAAIEAGHRGRPAAPGPGHPLRRAGRRTASRAARSAGASSRWPRGRGWPGCSRRPAPWSSAAAPATGPRPASCSRRSPVAVPGGRRAAQRPRLRPGRAGRRQHRRGRPRRAGRGDPDHGPGRRGWPRSRSTSPAAPSTRTSSR